MSHANNLINDLSLSFNQLFSRKTANKVAKDFNFVKRKPKKLDGFNFLYSMTLGRFKK